MINSVKTWRRPFYLLAFVFLLLLLFLHLRIGYPHEWDRVEIGMTPAQVDALCGPPTNRNGMKPDRWERPFLLGKWVLLVDCGDYSKGGPDVVYSLSLRYEHDWTGLKIRLRSEYPPIKDYAAFIRAFGFEPNPNIKYRVVEDR